MTLPLSQTFTDIDHTLGKIHMKQGD